MKQPIRLLYLCLFVLISCKPNAQENKPTSKTEEVSLSKSKKISYRGVPNDSLLVYIAAAAIKEPKYQVLLQKAKKTHSLTLDFQDYVDNLRKRMVEESGGAYTLKEATKMGYPELEGKPKGKKDKDSPQRIFVTGDYGAAGKKEPQGKVLAEKIKDLKTNYQTLIKDLPIEKKALQFEGRLSGEEGYDPTFHNGKSWSEFTFGHMPVAAIYPMLRKFQNDVRDSENFFLGLLMNQMDESYLSEEKRSYYALLNQLNVRRMSSPVVIDTEGFARKNPQYKKVAIQIEKVKAVTREFNEYLENLRQKVSRESGGVYTKEEAESEGNPDLFGKQKGRTNKEVPYRIFITGDDENEPEAKVLLEKIKELKANYLRLVGELWEDGGVKGTVFALQDKKEEILKLLDSKVVLMDFYGYKPKLDEGENWGEKTFGELPVAAINLVLYSFQRHANQSQMAVMNFLISPLKNYK